MINNETLLKEKIAKLLEEQIWEKKSKVTKNN